LYSRRSNYNFTLHSEVNGKQITTRNIIIASGGRPFVPPIPGLEESGYFTSDTIWNLRTLPKRLVILGGGPIGCELAQAFARLGSKVIQIQRAKHILVREDTEVSEMIEAKFAKEGIEVLTSHKALRVEDKQLICEHEGKEVSVAFDEILVAVGRAANSMGLEKLGITLTERGTVKVDEYMRLISLQFMLVEM
jgi:pyruvate/2-oxoglutarate dehydrogenase complex dihydrolipoamide dehydrogenase (E3) component